MKYGLCLGGGGAKGAYQVGAYKALKEFKQTPKIKAVSGTSIGALNTCVLGLDELEKAEEIWKNLTIGQVVKVRNPLNWLNPSTQSSILSASPMIEIFEKHVDFNKLLNYSKRKLYVGVTNLTKDIGENILLNNLEKDLIKKYVTASASMPAVFPNVIINNERYMDGYKYLNVPMQCLIYEKCDLIFAIPLSNLGAPTIDSYPGTIVVDINPKEFEDLNLINGTLNFTKEIIEERFNLGYENMKKMLIYLRKLGVIQVSVLDKFKGIFKKKIIKTKKYFCLDDII